MADYAPCRRGEKFFAPTIWYTMQQITPYILKTLFFHRSLQRQHAILADMSFDFDTFQ